MPPVPAGQPPAARHHHSILAKRQDLHYDPSLVPLLVPGRGVVLDSNRVTNLQWRELPGPSIKGFLDSFRFHRHLFFPLLPLHEKVLRHLEEASQSRHCVPKPSAQECLCNSSPTAQLRIDARVVISQGGLCKLVRVQAPIPKCVVIHQFLRLLNCGLGSPIRLRIASTAKS